MRRLAERDAERVLQMLARHAGAERVVLQAGSGESMLLAACEVSEKWAFEHSSLPLARELLVVMHPADKSWKHLYVQDKRCMHEGKFVCLPAAWASDSCKILEGLLVHARAGDVVFEHDGKTCCVIPEGAEMEQLLVECDLETSAGEDMQERLACKQGQMKS